MPPDDQNTTRYFRVALVAAWVPALWLAIFFAGIFPLSDFDLKLSLSAVFSLYAIPFFFAASLLPAAFYGTFRRANWVTFVSSLTAVALSIFVAVCIFVIVKPEPGDLVGTNPLFRAATLFSLIAVIGLWVTTIQYRKVEQSYPPKKVAH